jgi:hypothetical protein
MSPGRRGVTGKSSGAGAFAGDAAGAGRLAGLRSATLARQHASTTQTALSVMASTAAISLAFTRCPFR